MEMICLAKQFRLKRNRKAALDDQFNFFPRTDDAFGRHMMLAMTGTMMSVAALVFAEDQLI